MQAIDQLGDTAHAGASSRVREAEETYMNMEDEDPDVGDEDEVGSEAGSEGSDLSDDEDEAADADD